MPEGPGATRVRRTASQAGGCRIGESWLRIVTYDLGDDAGAGYAGGSVHGVLRMLSSRSGFRAGHWGVDADANVFAAVTFWSDATAVASARAHLDALQEERRMRSVDPTATMNLRVLGSPKPWKAQDWATLQEHSGATWMRLVRYRPDPHARSDAPDYLRSTTEVVLRVLRHQPGFRMGYWGHDPEAGTMAAVTYWASGEAIASTGSLFARLSRERLAHGIRTEHIGNFRLFPGSGPGEQVTP